MNEFKRMILKISDVDGAVATIPTSNDHTDGSWLVTDIYVGELFLNTANDLLQTRTEAGIVSLSSNNTSDTLIETLTIGVSRDLVLTDRNKNIENDGDITITVPPNSSVAFPIGAQIFMTKKTGSFEFAEGAGVTINSVENLLELGRVNSGASLLKIATDEWNLIGELV